MEDGMAVQPDYWDRPGQERTTASRSFPTRYDWKWTPPAGWHCTALSKQGPTAEPSVHRPTDVPEGVHGPTAELRPQSTGAQVRSM